MAVCTTFIRATRERLQVVDVVWPSRQKNLLLTCAFSRVGERREAFGKASMNKYCTSVDSTLYLLQKRLAH